MKRRQSSEEQSAMETAAIELIKQGKRYQQIGDALEQGNNQIYKLITNLLKKGKIKKVGPGQYAIPEGPIPEYIPPPRKKRKKADVVELIIEKGVIRKPEEIKLPKKDIEEIATNLMGKIGSLQPLLLLHKELFQEIESITMELVGSIIEVKPLILSLKQMDEYQELLKIKERAEQIVKIKRYQSK